jgi:transcriptional regulator with XRE-family HTH domain
MAVTKARGRRGRRGSDMVDGHIGRRLRDRRRTLGLSQAQLAERMGFTPPQINRYEHGTTRLSASGLWRAAEALEVPPSYFFDGLGAGPDGAEVEALDAFALKVARYLRTLSPTVRDKLISFIASLPKV